jgi:hypothetical protein
LPPHLRTDLSSCWWVGMYLPVGVGVPFVFRVCMWNVLPSTMLEVTMVTRFLI